MIHHYSKAFRIGVLTGTKDRGKFRADDGSIVPFYPLVMNSKIPIGYGEHIEEETTVVLLGTAVTYWENMVPKPKFGDTIMISSAITYLSPATGTTTMRVSEPSQIQVIPAEIAEAAPSTNGDIVQMDDFFRFYLSEKK